MGSSTQSSKAVKMATTLRRDINLAELAQNGGNEQGRDAALCSHRPPLCSHMCVVVHPACASFVHTVYAAAFVAEFSRLQDNTSPHSFSATTRIMEEAFGADWSDWIRITARETVGSGCIGQVYKGVMSKNGTEVPVAIKILHPNVASGIDADLDIMRLLARVLTTVDRTTAWLNPEGIVDEFEKMLRPQLDLNVEANNLNKFRENFSDDDQVNFPEPLLWSDKVLVEEFVDGLSLEAFLASAASGEVRATLCDKGIAVISNMIFRDNVSSRRTSEASVGFERDAPTAAQNAL